MRFVSSIIVVNDVARSRASYEDILRLKIIADFGIYNVAFEGGLSLYRKAFFQELTGGLNIVAKANSFVLYFETENIEAVENQIAENAFEFIHRIREQPWKQRTFRFYDHDKHILEIAESMEIVVCRLNHQNKTNDEIAKLTGLPVAEVSRLLGKC
jgi:hypothetical protein